MVKILLGKLNKGLNLKVNMKKVKKGTYFQKK